MCSLLLPRARLIKNVAAVPPLPVNKCGYLRVSNSVRAVHFLRFKESSLASEQTLDRQPKVLHTDETANSSPISERFMAG